jgi:hypothetical protein
MSANIFCEDREFDCPGCIAPDYANHNNSHVVTVLFDHDLPAKFQASAMYSAPDFDAATAEFKQWCESNGVFYYARPRESFFRSEAYRLAVAAGCTKLLLEDMS